MRTISKIFLLLTLLAVCGTTYAQSTKELRKERETIAKMSRAQLNERATKDARKEAKRLSKEGWVAAPGALPVEKQLDRSYMMQMEYNDDMTPKYFMGDASSVGSNYDGAKMQALQLAKANLAGQIQTEITAKIEDSVANSQLDAEEAATITKSVMASKSFISQSLGRILTVVEVYRTLSNKNKEVRVVIAYSSDMAKQTAINAIKKDLEQQGNNLHEQLDAKLGW